MKIQLKNIKKQYGSKKVIDCLNVEINSGELLALIGPSGCGKSTTLFMVSGLESVSDGNILFGEDDVTDLTADKRDIGLVFQNYALYPHYTVLQNVMFPLLTNKVNKKEAKQRALEILEVVKLTEHMNKKPGQLSGGQQQRVAIARAIIKRPKILLLDEPLSNLDAKLKAQTIIEIREIQRKFGITTIFVTHDQQEALAVSDRIAILNEGKIVQIDKPNELYRNPKTSYVASFIGSPSINLRMMEIKDGKLVGFDVLDGQVLDVPDGMYEIGIRPESFYLNEKSNFSVNADFSEILGRDILVHANVDGNILKIIVRNSGVNQNITNLKLSVSIDDVLIFDPTTKKRVNYEQVS